MSVRELYRGGRVKDDLSRFCCQNPQCPYYGQRGSENLSVFGRHEPDEQWRMPHCRTCQDRLSERKGTPLFGSTLPEEKVLSILQHLAEDYGVGETTPLLGAHRYAVMCQSQLVADPAREVNY